MILILLTACSGPSCGFEEDTLPLDGAGIAFQHNALPAFDISMSEEAINALPKTVDEPRGPNQYATVNYQQETFEVGLKLKGTSTFRSIDEKPSFNDVQERTVTNIDISKIKFFVLFMNFIIITNKF